MSESFQELFEESLKTVEMKSGSIVIGTIIDCLLYTSDAADD